MAKTPTAQAKELAAEIFTEAGAVSEDRSGQFAYMFGRLTELMATDVNPYGGKPYPASFWRALGKSLIKSYCPSEDDETVARPVHGGHAPMCTGVHGPGEPCSR